MTDEIKELLYQARRKQILEAAIVVISQQGFQRTTIKQIAKQAGIADGTIYNYFKNKEAIFFAIMERMAEGEIGDLAEAKEDERPFDIFITDYLKNRMDEMDRDYPLIKAVLPEIMINDKLQVIMTDEFYVQGMEIAEDYFETLLKDSAFADTTDVDMITRLFIAPVMGMLMLRLLGDTHVAEHWDEYTPALTKMILRMYE